MGEGRWGEGGGGGRWGKGGGVREVGEVGARQNESCMEAPKENLLVSYTVCNVHIYMYGHKTGMAGSNQHFIHVHAHVHTKQAAAQ